MGRDDSAVTDSGGRILAAGELWSEVPEITSELPQILRRCAGGLIGGRVMTQLQKGIARPYSPLAGV